MDAIGGRQAPSRELQAGAGRVQLTPTGTVPATAPYVLLLNLTLLFAVAWINMDQ
jgi:hypothetical protein